MHKNNYEGVQSYVIFLAQKFSEKLTESGLFLSVELEDLEQEFVYHYLKNEDKFDSTKSSLKHFIHIILENKYKDLVQKANIRNRYASFYSLDESIYDNDSNYGSGSNSSSFNLNEGIATPKDSIETHYDSNVSMEISVDVQKIFNRLPNKYKILLRLLQTHSFEEIAKELNVTTRTIYNMLDKLKTYFKEAGMDEYL